MNCTCLHFCNAWDMSRCVHLCDTPGTLWYVNREDSSLSKPSWTHTYTWNTGILLPSVDGCHITRHRDESTTRSRGLSQQGAYFLSGSTSFSVNKLRLSFVVVLTNTFENALFKFLAWHIVLAFLLSWCFMTKIEPQHYQSHVWSDKILQDLYSLSERTSYRKIS